MLQSPKNRSCPSRNCSNWMKPLRQVPGDRKGIAPSITSTSARALQKTSELNAEARC